MQSIRQMVRSLKGWLSGPEREKGGAAGSAGTGKGADHPRTAFPDLDMRSEERTGWTSKGKLKGTVGDFNKVMEALDFLTAERDFHRGDP